MVHFDNLKPYKIILRDNFELKVILIVQNAKNKRKQHLIFFLTLKLTENSNF